MLASLIGFTATECMVSIIMYVSFPSVVTGDVLLILLH